MTRYPSLSSRARAGIRSQTRPTTTRTRGAAALFCLIPLQACSSPEEKPEPPEFEVFRPAAFDSPRSPIGPFLMELDNSIERWQALTLGADNENDRRMKKLLEEHISYSARKRLHDLIGELQSRAPFNRMVAAAALGFTEAEAALGPLLASLDDSSPEVVANALLGLALLGNRDTPLAEITILLAEGVNETTRANAAYAVREVLEAGGSGTGVLTAARTGLRDESSLVRTHSALILAHEMDTGSLSLLEYQLEDETPLAALAAARSLAYIGQRDRHQLATVAMALAGALDTSEDVVRAGILRYLRLLSEANYGKEQEEWVEWAARLQ